MDIKANHRLAVMLLSASSAILLFFGSNPLDAESLATAYLALCALSIPCLAIFLLLSSEFDGQDNIDDKARRSVGLLLAFGGAGAFSGIILFLANLSLFVLIGAFTGLAISLFLFWRAMRNFKRTVNRLDDAMKNETSSRCSAVFEAAENTLRFVLTNSIVTLLWTGTFLLMGVALAISQNDIESLPQAGAMMVVGGVLLTSRRTLRLGVKDALKEEISNSMGVNHPIDDKVKQHFEFLADLRANRIGFWLIFLGTIIWAFGENFVELM